VRLSGALGDSGRPHTDLPMCYFYNPRPTPPPPFHACERVAGRPTHRASIRRVGRQREASDRLTCVLFYKPLNDSAFSLLRM
jgi:hypothetical protein